MKNTDKDEKLFYDKDSYEETMKKWDFVHKAIINGDRSSFANDFVENLVDSYEEDIAKLKQKNKQLKNKYKLSLKAKSLVRQNTVNNEENKSLRYLLWMMHGCPRNALYGDDGELQCHNCGIDFKRTPIKLIYETLIKRTDIILKEK